MSKPLPPPSHQVSKEHILNCFKKLTFFRHKSGFVAAYSKAAYSDTDDWYYIWNADGSYKGSVNVIKRESLTPISKGEFLK